MWRLVLGIAFGLSLPASASAEILEGRIASISVDDRKLSLETGEGLAFEDAYLVEGLEVGQLISVAVTDGSINIESITVLAEPEAESEIDYSAPVIDDTSVNYNNSP